MQTIIFGQQAQITQPTQPKVYIPAFARNQTPTTAARPQINTQGFHREIGNQVQQQHRTDVEEGGAVDGDPEPADHPRVHPPCPDDPQGAPITITDDFIDEIMNEIDIEEMANAQPTITTTRQQSTDVTDHTTDEETTKVQPIIAMPARKREQKAATKTTCPGCQAKFFKLDTTHNVCHNCVKIIGAIEAQCHQHHGRISVVMRGDQAEIVIRCNRNHEWTTQFIARQGRKWCKQCREDDKQTRRDQQERAEREEQARIAVIQEQHFQQAMQQFIEE